MFVNLIMCYEYRNVVHYYESSHLSEQIFKACGYKLGFGYCIQHFSQVEISGCTQNVCGSVAIGEAHCE